MSNKVLFISDLHLSARNPGVTQLFHHFIEMIAPSYTHLYIVGDFFEYWLGADIMDSFQQGCLEKLHTLAQNGTAIYFTQGNRDFLLNAKTLARYSIQLLNDNALRKHHGKTALICHGDHLCSLDIAYQRYKKIARNPLTKWLFLHSTQKFRRKLANKIHQKNPHGPEAAKPEYILADATAEAIHKEIAHYHPELIIHGHTHRMGFHWHDQTLRIVLGDWHQYGNYLEWTAEHLRLKSFQL
jgi:UDP-2,3-diacylglucosamine hydrolase